MQVRQQFAPGGIAPQVARLPIVETAVLPIHTGCLDCHGTIEKNPPSLKSPVAMMTIHQVQQLLAAADRKRRDQNISPRRCTGPEYFGEFVNCFRPAAVLTISIRALHQYQISLFHRGGVAKNRRAVMAQIAAESAFALLPALIEPDFYNRGTKDMPGIE